MSIMALMRWVSARKDIRALKGVSLLILQRLDIVIRHRTGRKKLSRMVSIQIDQQRLIP